jgi:hypothetical protein
MPLDLIKKQQIDSASVDKRYINQVAMIADQANQINGFIYFDGNNYWDYLGTVAGDINDYRLISSVTVISGFEMIEDNGSVVKFDYLGGYIYGNYTPVNSATITFDFTNGIRGVVSKMKFLRTSAPALPAEAKVVAGYFSVNTLNYLTFELVNKEPGFRNVWVTIAQEI